MERLNKIISNLYDKKFQEETDDRQENLKTVVENILRINLNKTKQRHSTIKDKSKLMS